MEFEVEALGPCRKKVAVTIPAPRVDQAFDERYHEINEKVPLKGFRQGRAPRKLLEKRFGPHLGDEVKEDLLKAALKELFESQKIEPLAPPEVPLKAVAVAPGQPLRFEFELLTRPEFETPAWKGLEVEVPRVVATDAEVEDLLTQMRRLGGRLEAVPDAALEREDLGVLDWEAHVGESVVARGEDAFYKPGREVLAGLSAPGLDEKLLGATPGTTVRVPAQVAPDDTREELRGKELELVATLKEVRRYQLAAIDAEWLRKRDYDDEEELREDLRRRVQRAKTRLEEQATETKLVAQLLGQVELSLPDEFVEQDLAAWAGRMRFRASVEGVSEEQVEQAIAAQQADARGAIEQELREVFVLDRIAAEEGVEALQEELAVTIEEVAARSGEPLERIAGMFRDPVRLENLRGEIRRKKVRELIRRHAKVIEVPGDAAPKDTPEEGPR